MSINKLIGTTSTITLFSLVFVLFTIDTAAQGRYSERYSRNDVDRIIRDLEDSGDEFRRDFTNQVNRSNMSGSQKSRYRDQVNNFENSTDRLRSHFDRGNTWWESRSQVQDVVSNARPLNTTMNVIAFRRDIERQWSRLRNEVNRLADTFDLPGIAGGGWTGGGGGFPGEGFPGGGLNAPAIHPPNWAVGRFVGTAPNGVQVNLSISSNGSVTAIINGRMSYGTFTRGNNLSINGTTSRVTRRGDGIRTVRNDNREQTDYSRTGGSGGGGGGGYYPPNQVSPPSWARGSFFAIAPNGTRVVLSISVTGAVTANNNGQLNYGSFTSGNMLYINGAYFRVSSISRGIRTVRTDNGETINYRRQ